jgi:osmotically-inducible protein OsmY
MNKIALILTIIILQGCAGALFASTVSGAYVVSSLNSVSEDKEEFLEARSVKKALKEIKKQNPKIKFDIDVIVFKNTIFLIGYAENKEISTKILNIILKKNKNYKLINEIKTSISSASFTNYLKKINIKTKLIFTNGVRYSNYYIAVFGDQVTIIGYAVGRTEYSLVLDVLAKTRGIKSIVNYIEVKDLEE